MSVDPLKVVGEILGEPARLMRNPVNAGYECPFMESLCTKRSQKIDGPYPICSVWAGRSKPNPYLMSVCPKRFYQVDFFNDVIEHCWPNTEGPTNPRVVSEIQMAGFGNVDFVIADLNEQENEVVDFVSVEMQAVDITGSVEPAYQGIINSQGLVDVSYGINWANVRKRYVTQLVTKGFFHHHWNSRIVAVLQTRLYDYMRQHINFDELPPNTGGNTVVFMLYDFQPKDGEEGHSLVLDRVVGTSHNSLMMGAMYQAIPDKSEFCNKIIRGLSR